MPDDPVVAKLVSSSDKVLQSVAEMKDMEERKRREKVSTPGYHQLAEEVEAKSREIFRAAADETAAADELESGSPSIEEIAAQEGDEAARRD
jgi:hypothetical protein